MLRLLQILDDLNRSTFLFPCPSVALKYLEELGCCQWLAFDVYSQTPLHVASGAGNAEIVHFLLQNDVSMGYDATRPFANCVHSLCSPSFSPYSR